MSRVEFLKKFFDENGQFMSFNEIIELDEAITAYDIGVSNFIVKDESFPLSTGN
jgi:hypothetical protein